MISSKTCEDCQSLPLVKTVGREAYHSCHAPNVGTCAPFRAKNNFRGAVLAGLDVVSEVMVYPAGIAQIGDFDRYHIGGNCHILLHLGFCGTTFIKRDTSDVFR